MEAALRDSLKAGLETAEPDTIFSATCVAALIPDSYSNASAIVQSFDGKTLEEAFWRHPFF
jgi:hypothetical protein